MASSSRRNGASTPSYTSYRYDPIWELCESLRLPVHTHSGPAAHADYGAVPGVLGLYATETIWWTARPMWFMLWSGVFERFPGLKMAVTESGSYWAPDLLWRMDSMTLKDQGSRKLERQRDGHPHHEAERVLRPQLRARVVEHAPA